LLTEAGVRVCAPVHDALLLEAPAEQIGEVVENCRRAMRRASELVLPGFPLRTEAKVVMWPDRYMDPRGQAMWDTVFGLLGQRTAHCG
jgi:DNA polymerase-1